MKVLVTGGAGRVGYFVLEELAPHYDLVVYDVKRPKRKDIPFIKGDILNLKRTREATQGVDAVVHLAGIPSPRFATPEAVMMVNTMGTYNVLLASAENGVKKLVHTSTDSTVGFCFRTHDFLPEYLPIDEKHPLRPQDPYGLSKKLSEEICAAFTRRYGIKTICLRPAWVMMKSAYPYLKQYLQDSRLGTRNLWVYIDARDAARAYRLALENKTVEHAAFFIVAKDIMSPEDPLTLVKKYFKTTPRINAKKLKGKSTYTYEKAKKILGFEPEHSWREYDLSNVPDLRL